MIEKSGLWLRRKWWGLLLAYFLIVLATYLAIWQFAEPLGIPDNIQFLPEFYQSRTAIHIVMSLLLGAYLTLGLELKLRRDEWEDNRHKANSFYVKTYPRSQHPQFFAEIESLVPVSKNIILVGAGINLVWEEHIIEILLKRAAAGDVKIQICMANPYSPHMQSRYIEEDMQGERPAVGYSGMKRNIEVLVDKIEQSGASGNITFSLFEHYPTLATLIFDTQIYIYSYPYHLTGNLSPIFHFIDDSSATARFLVDNANRIIHNAIPARDVVNVRRNRRYFSEKWFATAVYIIPDANSELYRFGSDILGYDIVQDRLTYSSTAQGIDVQQYVGEAREYGFHATICDALFFASEAGIDRLETELSFLTHELSPFMLANLKLVENYQSSNDIVLACNDDSGVATVLHSELIYRANKCAISSTYLANRTSKTHDLPESPRTNLMLTRYGAPFVLDQFQLHFTLCSSGPKDMETRSQLVTQLEQLLARYQVPTSIRVQEICLVVRPPGASRWSIYKRFPLSIL